MAKDKEQRQKEEKAQALDHLGEVLDYESYNWLQMQHPRIAEALDAAIFAGASKMDVRRLSWARTQRPEIVQRIVNASRYLEMLRDE